MQQENPKKVRVIDVAKAAGVSKATAVFSLNRRYDISISDETRQNVLETAKKMGYVPNVLAQALSTGKTGMINVVMPNTRTPFFTRYLNHFQRLISEARLTPIVTANYVEDENADLFLDRMLSWPCDGYILCYSKHIAPLLEKHAPGKNTPMVCVGEKMEAYDSIYSDNIPAIQSLLKHLADTGRKQITYVSDEQSLKYINDRYAQYKEHMNLRGIEPTELILPKRTRNTAYSSIRRHLKDHAAPHAFFCYNDELAIGVQRAVQDAGYRVPEDVAVTGFDCIPECDYISPRLTTAIYPYQEMCEKAWSFLQARMKDPHREIQTAAFTSQPLLGGSTQTPDRDPLLD